MHRTWKWAAALAVLGALAFGAARVVDKRLTQQRQDSALATQRSEAVVELLPTDLVRVQQRSLVQSLAVSGSLKAADSAFVKARVAGELQQLTLREGDRVKAGQVVARVDASDSQARLRQAQQQAAAAKAQVDIAQRNFDNNRALVAQGFISKWALDSSSANLAAAQATYQAAMAGVDLGSKQLSDTVLRAPISGVVSQRLAQNGERISVDGRIVEIVDLDKLELEASLAAADALQIELAQTAQLQIEGASAPVEARVVRINPNVVAGSRSVIAYLALAPTAGLRQGMFAQGRLRVGSTEAPSVPLSAVRTDKPKPYVQIVRDNKVLHQEVELGARGETGGQLMVAVTGLALDTVLVGGSIGQLREGTAVKLTTGP